MAIANIQNLQYKGVFKGTNEEAYRERMQYDVLLFPTRWDTEGVPGILAEAKSAGITAIVTNRSFSAELVKHGQEGILLQDDSAESLIEVITALNADRLLLFKLKSVSLVSAHGYYIENYIRKNINQVV